MLVKQIASIFFIFYSVYYFVFCREKVHIVAIANAEYCNLTWSLYGHAPLAKKPVAIGLGCAEKASMPTSPCKVAA
jgi:hypothetical protein